jgi:hypothetical protein
MIKKLKLLSLTKEYNQNKTEIQNNQSSNKYSNILNNKNMFNNDTKFIKENTPINKWQNDINQFDNMKKNNNSLISDNVKQSIAINTARIMNKLEQILYIQHCIA